MRRLFQRYLRWRRAEGVRSTKPQISEYKWQPEADDREIARLRLKQADEGGG